MTRFFGNHDFTRGKSSPNSGRARKFVTLPGVLLLLFVIAAEQALCQDIVAGKSTPEVVTEGYRFTEGPYWHADGYLLFSDIPANTIYKWAPGEDSEAYIKPSGNSNGITSDEDGNLILAQHSGKVSRVGGNKKMVTIADSYGGKRLNSPNDVVVHSGGAIFFTDPPFGVSQENRELDFSGVYRLEESGEPELIYDGFRLPNGIVFSPGESKMYVNDSETGNIIYFEMDGDRVASEPKDFANIGSMSSRKGGADGMVTDMDGRLYTTGPKGLIIFDSGGKEIMKFEFDEQVTNLAWGGKDNKWLFITASDKVYRLVMSVEGFKR